MVVVLCAGSILMQNEQGWCCTNEGLIAPVVELNVKQLKNVVCELPTYICNLLV